MDSPTWDQYMLPVLEALSDTSSLSLQALYSEVARIVNLSDDIMQEVVPSSSKPRYKDRIAWAATYLRQANAIARPKRATYSITQ